MVILFAWDLYPLNVPEMNFGVLQKTFQIQILELTRGKKNIKKSMEPTPKWDPCSLQETMVLVVEDRH